MICQFLSHPFQWYNLYYFRDILVFIGGIKDMKVKCVICDKIEEIDSNSFTGKRLRNHPLVTYVCKNCQDRITQKTEKRKEEGKLKLPTFQVKKDDW